MKYIKHWLATIVMLLCSLTASAQNEYPIDIASNADAMLYTNAPCTNTAYGDQFVGWHVLFDNDPNTFFHSEYSDKDSEDGLDHYLRVDLGKGNEILEFTFTYTTRGNDATYTPTRIVVEGSNTANGTYTEIAVLTDLPREKGVEYQSSVLGNGMAYRYIRYRVTETVYNSKVKGHPFFYFAEFGMMRVRIEGTCGDNLSWKLTDDNELIIEGTGKMYDYPYEGAPWYEYRESIQTITMGEGVTSIGEYAFCGCSSLTASTIPEGVTSIGSYAFYRCSSLTAITLPESVTSIGDATFEGCSSLTSISIPESVTSIGAWAFYGCSCLTAINIPEGVTSIGEYAFYKCSSLATITIPESVTSIGSSAFYNCSSLTAITCDAATPPTIYSNTFYSVDKSIPVYVPAGSVEAYQSAEYWSEFTNIRAIPNTSEGQSVITSLSQLNNNQLYYFSQPNHAGGSTSWAVAEGGDVLKSCSQLHINPDASDVRQHFAVISYDNGATRYLYHAAEQKFVCKDGTLGWDATDAIYFKNGAYANTFVAYFDEEHYVNVDGYGSVVINSWRAADGGNSCEILPVGEFDLMEIPIRVEIDGIVYRLMPKTKQAEVFQGEYTGNIIIPSMVSYDNEVYNVTSLGYKAFYNCRDLISVVLPTSLTSIGWCAFENCGNLTAINIPEGVISIGEYAFKQCRSLIEIRIPATLTVLNFETFMNCTALTTVTFSENSRLQKIEKSVFCDCNGLTDINIPEGVTSIGNWAFENCSSLASINIPKSVTSIGESSFNNCSSLTSVIIPEGLTSIGNWGLRNCSSLIYIISNAATPPTIYSSTFDSVDKTIPVYVPAGSVEAYKAAAYWSEFTNYQPLSSDIASGTCGDNLTWRLTDEYELVIKGTGDMYDYASQSAPWFEYRESISAITIEEGVTGIGEYAFEECSVLALIYIPNGIRRIGECAFLNCDGLTAVHISSMEAWCNIDFDGYFATPLYYARNLYLNGDLVTEVNIPNTLESVKDYTFYNCSALVSVTIPEGMTEIGSYAFYYCRSLTSVIVPEGVTVINRYAFQYCVSLESLSLPSTLREIGPAAISRCESLTNITIPEGVTTIGDWAFDNTGLASIVIPEGVTKIDCATFADCRSLASVTIPSSVNLVEDKAFSGCSGLQEVYCYATEVPSTSENAFDGCNVEDAILYVPTASALGIYRVAAPWSDFGDFVVMERNCVTITISKYGSGTYSSAYALDFSEVQGLKAYVATGYNYHTGVVTLLRVHTADAATGLLVKGTPGVSYEVPVMEYTADRTLNMLVATLERTEVDSHSSDGVYANYKYTVDPDQNPDEPMFYPFADGSHLSAGKAYLQIPVAWLPATGQKSIRYRFDEGETTDIEDEEIIIHKSEIIYDLYGRRVVSPKKGEIYIVNNQKVVY